MQHAECACQWTYDCVMGGGAAHAAVMAGLGRLSDPILPAFFELASAVLIHVAERSTRGSNTAGVPCRAMMRRMQCPHPILPP